MREVQLTVHGFVYSSVHFSFLRFDLSFARPLDFEESSVFRDRISRIRSKKTWKDKILIKSLQICKICLLCPRFRESLPRSQRRERRPIAAPDSGTPITELCVCRTSHTCCQPAGTECFHRSSHARFVPYKRKFVKNLKRTWRNSDLPKLLSCLETFVVSDGENAEKSFSTSEVIIADCRIIFLSSRVKNINLYFFAIKNDLKLIYTLFVGICKGNFIFYIPFFDSCPPLWARSLQQTRRTWIEVSADEKWRKLLNLKV